MYRKKMIQLIILVIAPFMGFDLCLPAFPAISTAFNSDASTTQWLISGYILSLSAGQLLSGPLTDRYGDQRIFIAGASLYLLAAAGVIVAYSISSLIFFRLLQGAGAGAMVVTVFATAARLVSADMVGRTYSLLNGTISVVPIVAPTVGSVLVANYHWRLSFYCIAVYVFFSLIFVMYMPLSSKQLVQAEGMRSFFFVYLRVLRHPAFLVGALVSSAGFATQLVFFSSAPEIIMQQLGIPVAEFGYWFAINGISIAVGSVMVSRLLIPVNVLRFIISGTLATLLAAAGFYIAVNLLKLSIGSYLLSATTGSLGFAFLMGAGASIALTPFQHCPGAASALLSALQVSFASMVAWLVMKKWDQSWNAMILCYLLLGILLGCTCLALKYFSFPDFRGQRDGSR